MVDFDDYTCNNWFKFHLRGFSLQKKKFSTFLQKMFKFHLHGFSHCPNTFE